MFLFRYRNSNIEALLSKYFYSELVKIYNLSVQFSSVAQSCPTLCDPMDYSIPGFPVHHQLLELTQTHVNHVGDAIQPSHPVIPFSSCLQSFPTSWSFLKSQFFTSGGQSTGVSASASVHPMNIQDWFPLFMYFFWSTFVILLFFLL